MSDEKVTLKVQIGGVSVEVSGSPEYAEKKLDELIQKYGPSRGTSQSAHVSIPTNTTGKPSSPSEFIKKLSPKNQSEKAIVLAYYLEKVRGMDKFTTADLTAVGREAKQPKFTNISDTVAKQVQQGLLMGAGGPGDKESSRAYILTSSGEEYVESLLSSKA